VRSHPYVPLAAVSSCPISVLDAKGGFGVSILGKSGTRDRDIALAKLVENRR